jgi:hypothetical protein
MNTGLDVRVAVRDANAVFGRFPARICIFPVLLGLLSYVTTTWWQPDPQQSDGQRVLLDFLIICVCGFVLFWLNCFIEVVVSSMCLRAREGEEPGGEQISKALHYRGFASLAGGLLLRCLCWSLSLGAIFGGAFLFIGILVDAAHTGPTSGIGATAGGVGHWFAIGTGVIVGVVFVIVATLIFCRYMFVFQMFAIERASRRGFLDECIRRTKQVWKTAAVVMIAGMIPEYLILGIEELAWKHWTPPHGVHMAVELTGALVTGCFSAWFMLVKTGLAMQLMTAPPAAIEPIDDRAAI